MDVQNKIRREDRVRIIHGDWKGWTGIVEGLDDWKRDIQAILRLENYYNYEKVTGHPFKLAGVPIQELEAIESRENSQ